MATAENLTVGDAAYEGAGARAGGQFRKQHMRKTTTPYDLPTKAHGKQQKYGWLSKVVDPASKLITSAANRIFGSVIRKCVLPTTDHSPGQITRDSRYSHPDRLPLTENHSAVCQLGNNRESRKPNTSFNRNRVAERKPMLMKIKMNKFTCRSDGVLGDKKEKCEVKAEDLGHENCAKQRESAIGARDLRDAAASRPAELAKAYMSAKASPHLSLAPKAASKVGISEYGFMPPCGPYSRIHSNATYKGAGTVPNPHKETHSSTSSQKAAESAQFGGSKKSVLKRRISILESDIRTVGPIRRIRRKLNLLSSRSLGLPACCPSLLMVQGAGTASADPHNHETHPSTSYDQKAVENVQFHEPEKLAKPYPRQEDIGELVDSRVSEPTRTAPSACPPKMAQALKRRISELESDIAPIRRIRQKPTLLYSAYLGLPTSGASAVSQGQSAISHGLEKMVSETPETLPPPEEKLVIVEGGGGPIEMTPSMLPGQAFSGLKKATSHHVPSSNYNSRQDTAADKATEEELTSSSKSDTEHGNNVGRANGDSTPSDKKVANGEHLPSDQTVASKASIATLDPPKMRPAFQMDAREDCLELDDDLQPDDTDTDFTFPILPALPALTFPIFSASSVVSVGVQPATVVPESISEVNNVPLLNEAKAAEKVSPVADQTCSAGIAPSNVGSGLFSFGLISSVGNSMLQACNASEPDVCTLFAPATQSMPSHLATSASIPAVGSSMSSISISASSEFGSFAASCPVLVSSSSDTSPTSVSGSFVFGSYAAPSPTLVSSSSHSSSLAQSVGSSSGIVSGIFGPSCQPAIGTSIGLGFNSSSQPNVFTFGAYSGSSASSNSTPSRSSGFICGPSFGPRPASNSAQAHSAGFTFGLSSCSGSANNSVPMVFGSTGSSSGSVFSFTPSLSTSTPTFTSTAPSASQPGFGSSSRAFAFGSPVPMIIDDRLEVDPVQASTPISQWPTTSFLFPTVAFGGHPEDSMTVDSLQASTPMSPPSTACFMFSTVAFGSPAEDIMAVDSEQASTPPRQVFGFSPMSQPSTTGFVFPADDLMNMDDSMAEHSVLTSTPGQLFGQSANRFAFPTGGSPFQFGALEQCCESTGTKKWKRGGG